jgi:hypothetical protein
MGNVQKVIGVTNALIVPMERMRCSAVYYVSRAKRIFCKNNKGNTSTTTIVHCYEWKQSD